MHHYRLNCNKNNMPLCKINQENGDEYFDANEIESFHDICEQKNQWIISNKNIGEKSNYGTARPGYCSNDKSKKYIFKIVSFKSEIYTKPKMQQDFDNEIKMQNIASTLDVTSPIYQVFKNDNFGLFVMDLYQITVFRFFLDELKKDNPNFGLLESIFVKCLVIVRTLKKSDILHKDIHLNNFMLENIETQSVKIIDFGLCVRGVPDENLNRTNSEMLAMELNNILLQAGEKYNDFLFHLAEIADKTFGYEVLEILKSMKKQRPKNIYDYLQENSKLLEVINFGDRDFYDFYYLNQNDDLSILKYTVFRYILKIKNENISEKEVIEISKSLTGFSFEEDELYDYYISLEDYLEGVSDYDPRDDTSLLKLKVFDKIIKVCESKLKKVKGSRSKSP
jgi:serine/threonine protein kinase